MQGCMHAWMDGWMDWTNNQHKDRRVFFAWILRFTDQVWKESKYRVCFEKAYGNDMVQHSALAGLSKH